MTTQRRTLELTPQQWARVETELLASSRQWDNWSHINGITDNDRRCWQNWSRDLLLAATQVKAAGAADHDGGPVGTARYTVR